METLAWDGGGRTQVLLCLRLRLAWPSFGLGCFALSLSTTVCNSGEMGWDGMGSFFLLVILTQLQNGQVIGVNWVEEGKMRRRMGEGEDWKRIARGEGRGWEGQ